MSIAAACIAGYQNFAARHPQQQGLADSLVGVFRPWRARLYGIERLPGRRPHGTVYVQETGLR